MSVKTGYSQEGQTQPYDVESPYCLFSLRVQLLSIGWTTALQQCRLQSCHGGWSEVHLHTIKLYQSLELGQECIS